VRVTEPRGPTNGRVLAGETQVAVYAARILRVHVGPHVLRAHLNLMFSADDGYVLVGRVHQRIEIARIAGAARKTVASRDAHGHHGRDKRRDGNSEIAGCVEGRQEPRIVTAVGAYVRAADDGRAHDIRISQNHRVDGVRLAGDAPGEEWVGGIPLNRRVVIRE